MNLSPLLSSIIAAASTLIGVGFPLIIFIVTNYNNQREKLLSEMKVFYPTLKIFRELIYLTHQVDFWKNKNILLEYKKLVRKGDTQKSKNLRHDYDFLMLYDSYEYISSDYSKEVMNSRRRVYSYREIERYQIHINSIYYNIYERNDIPKEIDSDSFLKKNAFNPHNHEQIIKLIRKLDSEYAKDDFSIYDIANIAREIEISIIDELSYLTWKYECPIQPIVKHLFGIFSITLLFGVILPLVLMFFSSTYTYIATSIILSIISICMILVAALTGRYIGLL